MKTRTSRGLIIQSLGAALLLLSACRFPDLPPLEGFSVGGTVSGLWTGAELTLTLSRPDADPQTVNVTSEGPFTFGDTLETGMTYQVEVATQPEMHACSVALGAGAIATGDVSLEVTARFRSASCCRHRQRSHSTRR